MFFLYFKQTMVSIEWKQGIDKALADRLEEDPKQPECKKQKAKASRWWKTAAANNLSEDTNPDKVSQCSSWMVKTTLQTSAQDHIAVDSKIPSSDAGQRADCIIRSDSGEAEYKDSSSTPDRRVSPVPETAVTDDRIEETNLCPSATEERVDCITTADCGDVEEQDSSSTPDRRVSPVPETAETDGRIEETNLCPSATDDSSVTGNGQQEYEEPKLPQAMASSKCDAIDFSAMDRELQGMIQAERKYKRENDAKLRAISQRVSSYNEFKNLVLASHLKPLVKGDIAAARKPFNPVTSNKK